MTSIHLPELRKVFTTPGQTEAVNSSAVTAQNLVTTLRNQEQVASHFNTDRGSRKEALMARARQVAFIGLCAVTAAVGAYEFMQDDPKPTADYIMQPGDRANIVAREFNPDDKEILNESDYIQSQDPNGDGVWEGGERVQVPYTELPENYNPPTP